MTDEERSWMVEAYGSEAPEWATWEACGMAGEQCEACGAWKSVVRPSKTACDNKVCVAKHDVTIGFDEFYKNWEVS
tara:strand:- start:337 stop:564 length:228 start_codon:yes stop_codon:yes gene_type:complete